MQVDDGNSRAAYPAAVEILKQLGVLEKKNELAELESFRRPVQYNHRGEETGVIETTFELIKHF